MLLGDKAVEKHDAIVIILVSLYMLSVGSVRRELSSTKAELADGPNMGACVAADRTRSHGVCASNSRATLHRELPP